MKLERSTVDRMVAIAKATLYDNNNNNNVYLLTLSYRKSMSLVLRQPYSDQKRFIVIDL